MEGCINNIIKLRTYRSPLMDTGHNPLVSCGTPFDKKYLIIYAVFDKDQHKVSATPNTVQAPAPYLS